MEGPSCCVVGTTLELTTRQGDEAAREIGDLMSYSMKRLGKLPLVMAVKLKVCSDIYIQAGNATKHSSWWVHEGSTWCCSVSCQRMYLWNVYRMLKSMVVSWMRSPISACLDYTRVEVCLPTCWCDGVSLRWREDRIVMVRSRRVVVEPLYYRR